MKAYVYYECLSDIMIAFRIWRMIHPVSSMNDYLGIWDEDYIVALRRNSK